MDGRDFLLAGAALQVFEKSDLIRREVLGLRPSELWQNEVLQKLLGYGWTF